MESLWNIDDYDIALSWATMAGNTDEIKRLVTNGADVNARDRSRYITRYGGYSVPILFNTVEKQHVEAVELLLKLGVFVGAIDKFGRNALHLACTVGNTKIVQLLLDYRANVNSQEHNCRRPIHIAASHGYSDIVKVLVDYGSSVNVNDIMGHTPLYDAAENGHDSVVTALMERGAFVHMDQETFSNSPLLIAYQNFHFSVVKALLKFDQGLREKVGMVVSKLHVVAGLSDVEGVLTLLKSGCNICAEDTKGRTILHIACKNGCLELVKLCLSQGMDVNKADSDGLTPLHYACEGKCECFGNLTMCLETRREKLSTENPLILESFKDENNVWTEIAVLLLDSGARVNGDSSGMQHAGWTPLCLACYSGNIGIIKLLVHRGANVNEGPQHFPLHTAVASCHVEAVKVLLASEAKVNLCCHTCGFDSFSPLHVAVYFGSRELVEMLLIAGADPNLQTGTQSSPLHYAYSVKYNSVDIADLLLLHGARLNIQNNNGDTALHEVCRSNCDNVELIKMLIDRGADVNIRNIRRRIPLHYACRKGKKEVIKILLQALSDIQVSDTYQETPLVALLETYMIVRNLTSSQVCQAMLPIMNTICPSYFWTENYTPIIQRLYPDGRPILGLLISGSCGSSTNISPTTDFLKMLWFNMDFEFFEQIIESGFSVSELALLAAVQFSYPEIGFGRQKEKEKWLSLVTECRSLQSFCRESIRRHIFTSMRGGQFLNVAVSHLPLPDKLKSYLLFNIEYPADMWE